MPAGRNGSGGCSESRACAAGTFPVGAFFFALSLSCEFRAHLFFRGLGTRLAKLRVSVWIVKGVASVGPGGS